MKIMKRKEIKYSDCLNRVFSILATKLDFDMFGRLLLLIPILIMYFGILLLACIVFVFEYIIGLFDTSNR